MEELKQYYNSHIKQQELANKLGITSVQISRWISGERPVPEKHKSKIKQILKIKG